MAFVDIAAKTWCFRVCKINNNNKKCVTLVKLKRRERKKLKKKKNRWSQEKEQEDSRRISCVGDSSEIFKNQRVTNKKYREKKKKVNIFF